MLHLSIENCPQGFYHHILGTWKILIPPGSIFLKIRFPQQQKVWRKLIWLYQNSVRKYEDDLEH